MDTTTDETQEEAVAVDTVEFTSRTDAEDVSISVTQSTEPTAEAPDYESDEGTEPGGYVDIDHDIDNADVENVDIEFRLSKDRLGPDEEPDDVALYRAEDEAGEIEWNELDTEQTGETETHYVFEAESPGLSNFVVGVKQAQFRIADAAVSVAEVQVREETQVVAQVTNTGGADGTFVVELVRDDETVASRSLTIAPNGTRRTTFDQQFAEPGDYDLFVNDVFAATVTVEQRTATPAPTEMPDEPTAASGDGSVDVTETATPTATTTPDGETSVFSPGFGPVIAVLALLVTALSARLRRRT
jgi:PGF-pre-PGF domain-containing protein/PGF-CTERM protein